MESNDEMKGRILAVSLGPGDPGLVTLKALDALQKADVVFCPGTRTREGRVKSWAMEILRRLPVEEAKIRLFPVPMSPDRQEAEAAYDRAGAEMRALAGRGKAVAVVAEGDACFYSSASYLCEKLRGAGMPVEAVAGVPAFIAAGAAAGVPLAEQQERLLVVPGDVLVEELLETVVARRTLVVMKVSLGEAVLRPFMARHVELRYHYFERIGTPQEFRTSVREEILARAFAYFSLLIVKPGR